MAINKIYKFANYDEIQDFLNGGVFGGVVVQDGSKAGVRGLTGKTFIVQSTPVTFVATTSLPGDPDLFLFKDIKAQIEAAVATVTVKSIRNRIVIIEKTPTSGVTVTKTGTANALLGFDSSVDTAGKVYNEPSSASTPKWVWFENTGENSYVVITRE